MAKRLQLIDFKSQGDEKPLEFDCTDGNATILDVKRFVDKEEGLKLKDLTKIQLYWLFAPLQDDVSVKDLLEQNVTEVYVSLPQYANITATSDEIVVFSKEKNIFNQGFNKQTMKLHAGCTTDFKIPEGGKFAVSLNKSQGKEQSFNVQYYEVEDDWKIEIEVSHENLHNFKVFQVLDNGNKKELKAGDAKEFSMDEWGIIRINGEIFKKSVKKIAPVVKSAGPFFAGLCTIVAAVI